MATETCYVTIVFKSGERASVWMEKETLEKLTSDFVNNTSARKVYPLAHKGTSTTEPDLLAVAIVDIAHIN